MEPAFLQDIVIIFALAVVVLYLFNRMGLPAIVGFLLTGMIAGPHGLALVKSAEQVQAIAELGVILLLFSIGLEFSFKSMINIGRTVLLGGSLQVGLTIAAAFAITSFLGLPTNQALFIGFLMSLSSTAIVLRQLGERAELDSPHGKINLGILIFQDIIVVVMMLFTPLLANPASQMEPVGSILLKSAAVIVVVILISLYVVPPLLYQITRTQSRELFLLSIFVICFSVAELTSSIGLSLALGAFLAGLSISESEYSHQALANIIPFLDTFTSVFFVSIGMLLNLTVVVANLPLVLLVTLMVLLIKGLICIFTTLVLGYPLRTAILVGLSLAQVGEFAFILSQVGRQSGLLGEELYQGFLSASILTMMLTPFLITASPRIASLAGQFSFWRGSDLDMEDLSLGWKDHLVIIGYGVNGRNLARAADYAHVPYVILDLNSETVRTEQKAGQPIMYGDATHPIVLEKVNIESARVVVIAISDPTATLRITAVIKRMNPSAHIIVRTRFVADVPDLHQLGANEVIPEEYETSIEIFTRVLARYMVPVDEIESYVDLVRSEDYEMFRRLSRVESEDFGWRLTDIDVWSLRVGQHTSIAGQKLVEADFRNRLGVTILAIRRNEETLSNPGAEDTICPGDHLIMMGKPEQIRTAARLLEGTNCEPLGG